MIAVPSSHVSSLVKQLRSAATSQIRIHSGDPQNIITLVER